MADIRLEHPEEIAGHGPARSGEAQPGLALAQDRGQWLGDLVGDAGSHLADGVDPHRMGELRIMLVQAHRLPRPPAGAPLPKYGQQQEEAEARGDRPAEQQARRQQLGRGRPSRQRQHQRLRPAAERLLEGEIRDPCPRRQRPAMLDDGFPSRIAQLQRGIIRQTTFRFRQKPRIDDENERP